MKFFTTVTVETYGECIIDAPSREAAEEWMAQEKRDGFRNWFLDMNDSDSDTNVGEYSGSEGPDIYVNEDGKEYTPARNAS